MIDKEIDELLVHLERPGTTFTRMECACAIRSLRSDLAAMTRDRDIAVSTFSYQSGKIDRLQSDLAAAKADAAAVRELLTKQTHYSMQLQQLIGSLRHDGETPHAELHHHAIIVNAKRDLAAAKALMRDGATHDMMVAAAAVPLTGHTESRPYFAAVWLAMRDAAIGGKG